MLELKIVNSIFYFIFVLRLGISMMLPLYYVTQISQKSHNIQNIIKESKNDDVIQHSIYIMTLRLTHGHLGQAKEIEYKLLASSI